MIDVIIIDKSSVGLKKIDVWLHRPAVGIDRIISIEVTEINDRREMLFIKTDSDAQLIMSYLIKKVFGAYTVDENKWNTNEHPIGRTFFSDRMKHDCSFNSKAITNTIFLYNLALAGKSSYDPVYISGEFVKSYKECFGIDISYLQYEMDDNPKLRKYKFQFIMSILKLSLECVLNRASVNWNYFDTNINKSLETSRYLIQDHCAGTYTEQVLKKTPSPEKSECLLRNQSNKKEKILSEEKEKTFTDTTASKDNSFSDNASGQTGIHNEADDATFTSDTGRKNSMEEGNDYYLLDNYTDNVVLPFAPCELRIVCLYYITLTYPSDWKFGSRRGCDPNPNFNDFFLLLKHTDCTTNTMSEEMSSEYHHYLWSVPFISLDVPLGKDPERLQKVGEIRSFFTLNFQKSRNEIKAAESQLLRHLGLHRKDVNIVKGNSYTEYKKAVFFLQDKWECCYTQEYYISNVNSADVINLTDPEDLYGYKYYELSDFKHRRFAAVPSTVNGETKFLGKFIPRSITRHLFHPEDLLQHSISVQENDVLCHEAGLLIKLSFHPVQKADEIESYISNLTKVLNHIIGALHTDGITQFQFTDNYFIIALSITPSVEGIRHIYDTIRGIAYSINDIYMPYGEYAHEYHTDCYIMYTKNYEYGCPYGLDKQHAIFSDESVIELEKFVKAAHVSPKRKKADNKAINLDMYIDERLLSCSKPDFCTQQYSSKPRSFVTAEGETVNIAHFVSDSSLPFTMFY